MLCTCRLASHIPSCNDSAAASLRATHVKVLMSDSSAFGSSLVHCKAKFKGSAAPLALALELLETVSTMLTMHQPEQTGA